MADKIKCACDECICMVDTNNAFEKDGQYYCDESCSNGHIDHVGCGHEGCGCH